MTGQHARVTNKTAQHDAKRQSPGPRGHETAPDRPTGNGELTRVTQCPAGMPGGGLLALQQRAGNQAVSGMVQGKTSVGAPRDVFEVEADRAADGVMSGQVPRVGGHQAGEDQPEGAQRTGGGEVSPSFEQRLKDSAGGGGALPAELRHEMEGRFGADFDDVRIHAGSDADELNDSVHAQAFTLGHDVYFAGGRYAPETDSGKRLLAHELTHVIQQTGESGTQSQGGVGETGTSAAPGAVDGSSQAIQRFVPGFENRLDYFSKINAAVKKALELKPDSKSPPAGPPAPINGMPGAGFDKGKEGKEFSKFKAPPAPINGMPGPGSAGSMPPRPMGPAPQPPKNPWLSAKPGAWMPAKPKGPAPVPLEALLMPPKPAGAPPKPEEPLP